tara:strand:- start:151 stop:807 length:657 start_codon:yes stop_codon:yes gene_type:complete
MFPLDQQDIDHIAPEGWLRIASLVAIALEILGMDAIPLPRGLAAKALLVLKPAEAMARRLLYLMAPDIKLSVSPAYAGASASPISVPAAGRRGDRSVTFRFTEPLGPGPKNTGPRIRFFNEPPRPPKPVRVPQPKTSAPLLARIRALQAVIDQPDTHAKRFARWIARRKAKGHPRPVAFAFLKIPGINRKRLLPEVKQDLRFFNDAAFYKLQPPPEPG